jgi:hypothetical protein
MNALNESSRSSIVVFVIEESKLPLLEIEALVITVQKLLINAVLIGITCVVLDFISLTFTLTNIYDLRSRSGL